MDVLANGVYSQPQAFCILVYLKKVHGHDDLSVYSKNSKRRNKKKIRQEMKKKVTRRGAVGDSKVEGVWLGFLAPRDSAQATLDVGLFSSLHLPHLPLALFLLGPVEVIFCLGCRHGCIRDPLGNVRVWVLCTCRSSLILDLDQHQIGAHLLRTDHPPASYPCLPQFPLVILISSPSALPP